MNITKENIDDLNAVLKVNVVKEDYEEKVNTVLKDYRKKANIPGFRPGKVPIGMISKMYRRPVMLDEVNKLISESISKYIVDENIKILGDPMPSKEQYSKIDFDTDEEFEFKFDIGLQPEFEVRLSNRDKVKYYSIKVNEELIDKYQQSYAQRFGAFKPVDEIVEKEMIVGTIEQIDEEGKVVDDGISAEDSRISVEMIKDEDIKKTFFGLKAGNSVSFDIKKAFPANTEIAAILKIKTEEVEAIKPDFKFTIKEITKFEQAEVNQELFDKVYGKDNVKSVEEFRNKIADEIKLNLTRESDYKFLIDLKETLTDKVKCALPVEFLKRWLKEVNKEKMNEEQVENEFPKFEVDLKWQLIKNNLIKENEMKVSEDEVRQEAKNFARMQFVQYGITNIPDEHLEKYTSDILNKEDEKSRIYEKLYEDKVLNFIKENIKVDKKEVTSEEFNKLFEKK